LSNEHGKKRLTEAKRRSFILEITGILKSKEESSMVPLETIEQILIQLRKATGTQDV
jgi:hypothetical protein